MLKFTFFLLIFTTNYAEAGWMDYFFDYKKECEMNTKTQSMDGFEVGYSVFKNKNKNSDKALFIFPPTGGKNILDVGYAYYFCKRGYEVYVLETWSDDDEYDLDFSIHRKSLSRTKKAIDIIMTEIPNSKVAWLGTSLGGMIFNIQAPKYKERLSAYYNIASGYPYCEVVAHSNEEILKEAREKRFKKYNIKDMADYQKRICEAIGEDIELNWSKPFRYGFSLLLSDTTVPTVYQERLSLERVPDLMIKTPFLNHRMGIVKTYLWDKKKIFEFIDQSF